MMLMSKNHPQKFQFDFLLFGSWHGLKSPRSSLNRELPALSGSRELFPNYFSFSLSSFWGSETLIPPTGFDSVISHTAPYPTSILEISDRSGPFDERTLASMLYQRRKYRSHYGLPTFILGNRFKFEKIFEFALRMTYCLMFDYVKAQARNSNREHLFIHELIFFSILFVVYIQHQSAKEFIESRDNCCRPFFDRSLVNLSFSKILD